ncbi:peptidyl-prolyl cis-trans isomerase FKBP10 [Pimephales promelas]|nr:peptidyl-prolyl cis-trans isomerase FKBP10 [Pimephales promelas]KAG1935342.1 peptidyl-prolyl cis-trans isomerase FKBP10 [Pimephales promelas]
MKKIRFHVDDGSSFKLFGRQLDDYPEPPRVTLGQGKLISGLDEGLQGMCVLERREITVPPHLAHGTNGALGVPSSAVLLFELELLQLQKGVPEGFLFIWLQKSPEPLFPVIDMNQDQEVPLEEGHFIFMGCFRGVSLVDICTAATWATPCTFARFYKVNIATHHAVSSAVLLEQP